MKKVLTAILALNLCLDVSAQSAVKEYVDKTGIEKIKKQIVIDGQPATAGSYDDGHGRNPYLTSPAQIPDTLALITFYIYDKGSQVSSSYYIYNYSLSVNGGNYVANAIHKASIAELKAAYKKIGIVLLTPDEFLNTKAKRDYYYNTFQPQVSKMGNFLSSLETKGTDVAVWADHYRGFDISAASDHQRMEALGNELTRKLGVDGTLSIALELITNKKEINITGIKMALHGKNPIPRQDKKYVAQNMGAGYYAGQLYTSGYFYFDKPLLIGEYKKNQIVNEQYEGISTVLECYTEKFNETMKKAIEKISK